MQSRQVNMDTTKICIVIPSYEPADNLLTLLENLHTCLDNPEHSSLEVKTLLVDDGSGPEYESIFLQAKEKYSCILLRHASNLGKGRALKTAFNYVLNEFPNYQGVATVDSDGQHTTDDIIRCIKELSCESPESSERSNNSLVCGCRDFNSKEIPFKSRFGNVLTKRVFSFFSGVSLSDTQTGLRVIPMGMLKMMLAIPGERFEYEMNMLIECSGKRISIKEVKIDTVYIENNKGTHFHPLFDSIRIYTTFLKYIASSLGASFIDFLIFFIVTSLYSSIALATVCSRTGGAAFNFIVNRNIVFKSHKSIPISVLKYVTLAAVSGVLSYNILTLMHGHFGFNLLVCKAIAETALFLVNFFIQKTKIFN